MSGMGIPGKKRGWSTSGALFQNQPLRNIPSLQCQFQEDPQNYTVQFRITGKDGGSLANKQAQAEIVWSVEGNNVRRLITIADGASVQGTGQTVKVTLSDVSTIAPTPPDEGEYVVSAQVVPGTRGSTSNPPVLWGDSASIAGPGGSATLDIPVNAGIVSVGILLVSGTSLPIADQSILVQQSVGPTVVVAYNPFQYFWVPLAPGATNIIIFNQNKFSVNAQLIFGIDG